MCGRGRNRVDTATEAEPLVRRLKDGDRSVLGELFGLYREHLRRMVDLRLDSRLNGRIDTSDVLQDAYLDAMRRVDHFLKKPDMPFHVWLRLVAAQTIVDCHRQHLGAQMRDAGQEQRLEQTVVPQASSVTLAKCLAAQFESPSHAAMRHEVMTQVERALDSMDPLDREVLALRHFEELTNDEVAAVLNLQKSAASNRYVRALRRLKEELARIQ